MEKELRVIISGGGTGGHIFPAVSIANAVKNPVCWRTGTNGDATRTCSRL